MWSSIVVMLKINTEKESLCFGDTNWNAYQWNDASSGICFKSTLGKRGWESKRVYKKLIGPELIIIKPEGWVYGDPSLMFIAYLYIYLNFFLVKSLFLKHHLKKIWFHLTFLYLCSYLLHCLKASQFWELQRPVLRCPVLWHGHLFKRWGKFVA